MHSSATQIEGLEEVYAPQSGEADVDIVAIHGLNGNAVGTWTNKNNGKCWLHDQDFLPKYLSNARILVYGYNASFNSVLGGTPSPDRIHRHSHSLVAELCADRRVVTDSQKLEGRESKPIIFLCHSLGGIIVKRALVYSKGQTSNNVAHLQQIAACTYGILFFGTPHNGSDKAPLLGTLQKMFKVGVPRRIIQTESDLVKALEAESETLQNITDTFLPLMKQYRLFYFWEERPTDLGYTKEIIVPNESAAPPYDNVEKSGIAANHSDMVKFDSNRDRAFRKVAEALKRYARDAPEIIERRSAALEQDVRVHRQREMEDLGHSIRSESHKSSIGYRHASQSGYSLQPTLPWAEEHSGFRRDDCNTEAVVNCSR